MKTESARSLWIFSLILAVIGSAIPSPSGGFFLSVIAVLVAIPPTFFGKGHARLGGAIACIFALMLAVTGFSAMQKDQAAYVESVKRKNTTTSVPAPAASGEVTPGNMEKVK